MVSLNPALSQAEVVLCGHPAPLLLRTDEVRQLEANGLPILTMLRDRAVNPLIVDLDDDWGLLLFTDGLVEGSVSPGATERLGVDGLARHLRSLLAEGVAHSDLAPLLLAEAERRHGGPLTDDVAVLLIGSRRWWR
jgi:serine phosphatase RsbU (regulator of sigma subunit)